MNMFICYFLFKLGWSVILFFVVMHEGEDLLKTIPRSERSKTYNGDLLAPECVTEVISTEQNNRQKDQKSECRSFKWKVLKFCEIHPKTTTVLSRVLIFIFLVLFNGFGAQVMLSFFAKENKNQSRQLETR